MNNFVLPFVAVTAAVLASMGVGGGGILVTYMTLGLNLEQKLAQGINLAFFVLTALIALVGYAVKRQIEYKVGLVFLILGLVGAFLGCKLILFIDGKILSKLFGVFLVIIGVLQLISCKKSDE